MTPSVRAALALREAYARGGIVSAVPLPAVSTPGLAAPRGLTAPHHRLHFADGGALPSHIAAALALRPHFEDGGDASGSDHSSSSSSGSSGSGDGDGHGNSSSSSSSGSAGGVGGFGGSSSGDGYGGGSNSSTASGYGGGVGGFGGGSNDGYGGGNSSSSSGSSGGGFSVGSSNSSGGSSGGSSSSGSAGGVGGFGGGSNDGYGGSSSGGNSNSGGASSASGSAGGVGGFGGGASDGYGGGSGGGTQSSGGFSSGAASGADGGDGGAVGGSGGFGGFGGSNAVGSISGSYGAPAAGGFSNDGAPSTGGFGSFGAGPAANDASGGLTGVSPSASMMSGYTAGQSMSNEAANGGEAGEDGTGSMNGVSAAGAFGSFGLGPSSPSSPFGGLDSARAAFGNTASDGMTGTTPSSVGMSNPDAVAGLSPSGQMMGVMGMGGIDTGIASMSNVGTTGALNGPGAYGLSGDKTPGFDNFNSASNVTQSSLGQDGYTGGYGYGVQSAMNGDLSGPEGYAGAPEGTSPGVAAALAAGPQATDQTPAGPLTVSALPAPGQPMPGLPDYGKPFTPNFDHWNGLVDGVDQTQHPGYVAYGPNGPISTTPTSATPGLNADGDPTAVDGMSALTVHGTLTPGAQAMSDGVPTGTGVHTQLSPSYAAADGLAANRVYSRSADAQESAGTVATIAGTAIGKQSLGMGFNPSSATDTSFGPSTPDTSAPGITDSQVAQARQNLANGTGTDEDRATVRDYLVQQNTPPGAAVAATAPASPPAQVASTTPGVPPGSYYAGLHKIEGGVLNGQVDPNNPTHYGPAQFSQATWSGVARNNPDLGLPSSMFSATPEQYAKATEALTQENARALQDAGLPATPANLYTVHNLGAPMGIAALQAGPDASLTAAGISPAIQQANPSIYGGVSTIGQLQSKLDAKFSGTATDMDAAPASVAHPAITVHSIGEALGDGTAAQVGRYTGAGTGMDGIGNAGLGQMGTMGTGDFGAAEAANTGKFGTITAHNFGDPQGYATGMFGEGVSTAHDAPGVPAFAGMAGRNAAADGTISNEGMATPSSERGYTDFAGNPVEYGSGAPDTSAPDASPDTSDGATPTTDAPAKHLSVPAWAGNGAAGMLAGAALGPVGTALGIGNTISGWMGGPTAADGINAVLSHPGAPTGVTGGGDNSSQPGADRWGSSMPAPIYGPSGGQGGDAPAAPAASAGINPLDPHATAIAAYQAALAGMGKGSGTTSSATDTTDAPRPLVIHPRRLNNTPAQPLYNPMADAAVRRALGLD